MGARNLAYWAGTFAFDFIAFAVSFQIFILFVYLEGLSFLTNYIFGIFLLMTCFGVALISYSYACGFLFQKVSSAEKTFPIINFFILWGLPYVFTLITDGFLNDTLQCLFCMISPFFALDRGNFHILIKYKVQIFILI